MHEKDKFNHTSHWILSSFSCLSSTQSIVFFMWRPSNMTNLTTSSKNLEFILNTCLSIFESPFLTGHWRTNYTFQQLNVNFRWAIFSTNDLSKFVWSVISHSFQRSPLGAHTLSSTSMSLHPLQPVVTFSVGPQHDAVLTLRNTPAGLRRPTVLANFHFSILP